MSACPPCGEALRPPRRTAFGPNAYGVFAERVLPYSRTALLMLCILLLASCGFRKARGLAENAVKDFHDLMNREQYDTIYNASDDSLKKSMSRADFASYLEDIHTRLGDARKTTVTGFSVSSLSGQGSQVALALETDFDRGTAQERFLWRVTGGRAVLLEYRADIERSTGPRTVQVLQPTRRDSRLTSSG